MRLRLIRLSLRLRLRLGRGAVEPSWHARVEIPVEIGLAAARLHQRSAHPGLRLRYGVPRRHLARVRVGVRARARVRIALGMG